MSTLSELNYVAVIYSNNGASKMSRMPCNMLMPITSNTFKNYWVNETQTFYTHIGLEQNNHSSKVDIQSPKET